MHVPVQMLPESAKLNTAEGEAEIAVDVISGRNSDQYHGLLLAGRGSLGWWRKSFEDQ